MKKISILAILVICGHALFGQVGGISNAKLAALNIEAVGHQKIEFEPTVFHVIAKKAWDQNGNLDHYFSSPDSVIKNSGLSFRFTYGLWDVLEIGGSISTDLSNTNLGAKYKFWSHKKMGLAAVAGARIPLGNKTIDKTIRIADNLTSIGGGIIYSFYLNERFSLDASSQYLFFAQATKEDHKGTFYFNSDIGYYIFNNNLQLVVGFGYLSSFIQNITSTTWTIYPGFTVHSGKNFVLILQAPFDVAGKNALKNAGVAFSLTITID